ncbi:hypothetical protein FIBSPDRAFT_877103 [Athelia psychrophila]|uniref:Uncharacterized protein n=1 Tax=Athelia psychrophila TaxID=1759441 RepID=A0A167W8E7_9AGAM|nr:hypothetical protein FIBSPDRAFT_877103 [Fibularhizoctonia sp. CBS 109695]
MAGKPPPSLADWSRPTHQSPDAESLDGPPPPPARRAARPGQESPYEEETSEIDWANLSEEDKQVFFSWLDEFFARYRAGNPAPAATPPVSSRSQFSLPPAPPTRGPPPVNSRTRPPASATSSYGSN